MATCNSCDGNIVWARTEARDDKPQRNIPLDSDDGQTAAKYDDGNLVIVGATAGRYGTVPVVRYVSKGAGKMRSHFASCPNASVHRKK